MTNKAAKPVFIASGVLAFFALVFGLCMLFGRHLPEGVLVVGLGFCIFGTAGLLTTLGGDGKSPDAKASKPKRQKKTEVSQDGMSSDRHTRKQKRASFSTRQERKALANEKSYEILVNPTGYSPIQSVLMFADRYMKIISGDEMLTPRYSAIDNLRFKTPVIYIDWKDGTTWEMRFVNPMATSVVYKKLVSFME